jgi:DNA-binding response OmpR family regulator
LLSPQWTLGPAAPVFVVDDEPMIRVLLAQGLADTGYLVVTGK